MSQSGSRVLLIARTETSIMLGDPTPIIFLIAMPVVLLMFLANGLVGGPAHSVPGLAALFGFFGLSHIGIAFFRDHGWSTWDRFRTSAARPIEVLVGKAAPLAALFVLQQLVLLFIGWLVFGMPWRGSFAAGGALILAIVCVQVSFGLFLVAICRTIHQHQAFSNLGALLIAGMGGALAPLESMPSWVRAIAPASPAYWALRGFRVVIEGAPDGGAILVPIAVLAAMAAASTLATLRLYRFDAPKAFFA